VIECLDSPSIGEEIFSLARNIFPICRSITGDGVRETLRCLSEHIDLKIYEVPSGTEAFDWSVPQEWNIRDAYIKDSAGNRVVDFHACNLHVVSYSTPIRAGFRYPSCSDISTPFQSSPSSSLTGLPIIAPIGGSVWPIISCRTCKRSRMRF